MDSNEQIVENKKRKGGGQPHEKKEASIQRLRAETDDHIDPVRDHAAGAGEAHGHPLQSDLGYHTRQKLQARTLQYDPTLPEGMG